MKITPVSGTGVVGQSLTSTVPDQSRIERAKAIFEGVTLKEEEKPQLEETKPDIKTIKVKTNFSTNRDDQSNQEVVAEPETTTSQIDTADNNEQVNDTDETKSIDPQVARLMRVKRALQVKERELAEREAAIKKADTPQENVLEKLKANPLSVLQEAGVTYDQLTEAILADQSGVTPEVNQLKADLKALKEEFSSQLTTRDQQAEQQVLAEMKREAVALTSQGEQYEAIQEARRNNHPDFANGKDPVSGLIHKHWQKTGEIMPVETAAELVENQLLEEAIPFAKLKKVQSRLTPAQVEQQAEKLATQKPFTKVMRTLTNRDTAMPVMDRRARAIAAMQGTLKKG